MWPSGARSYLVVLRRLRAVRAVMVARDVKAGGHRGSVPWRLGCWETVGYERCTSASGGWAGSRLAGPWPPPTEAAFSPEQLH